MKMIMAFWVFVLGFQAFACDTFEAQFIGEVESVSETAQGCSVKLSSDFKFYAVHVLCPLYESDLVENEINVSSCDLKKGDQISGVAVYDQESGELYLED